MNRSVPTPGTNYAAKLNPTTQRSDQVSNYCMSVFRASSLPQSYVPWASKDDLRIFRRQNWSGRIFRQQNWPGISQPAVCGTTGCDSHPWDRSLTLQSMANLRASMSAELRSLVVSKPNTKLSSFLGCQKIACGAASPPPLIPQSWKQIAGIRSEYSLCFRIPATYSEWSRSELLQLLEVVPTEYLHWRRIEFLRNDCLFSSESHPKSPNAKNMKGICRLSNTIHLKNNNLPWGIKMVRKYMMPSHFCILFNQALIDIKTGCIKKEQTRNAKSYVIIGFRIPHKSLHIIGQSCSCLIKVTLAE